MTQVARTHLAIFIFIGSLSACASAPAAEFARLRADSADRKVIRTGAVTVEVDEPSETLVEVTRLVVEAGGFVERSDVIDDDNVLIVSRVPEPQLDATMDAISALGAEKKRSLTAADVTEQHSDLSTRLKNNIALRDRLRVLLERAEDVEDVLAIEKELNRVQSEVEAMQARLDRLNSRISLSELTVTLKRKQILGPFGLVGYWVFWGLSKLFVIQ